MVKCAALLAVTGLVFAAVGAAVENAPVRTAGPMNIDFRSPLGAVCLLCGLALIEAAPRPWKRRLFLLAALLVAVVAGRNLYFYPPVDDGAYFMLRYGRDAAGDWAPAGLATHMLAFAAVGWALLRAQLSRLSRYTPGRLR